MTIQIVVQHVDTNHDQTWINERSSQGDSPSPRQGQYNSRRRPGHELSPQGADKTRRQEEAKKPSSPGKQWQPSTASIYGTGYGPYSHIMVHVAHGDHSAYLLTIEMERKLECPS